MGGFRLKLLQQAGIEAAALVDQVPGGGRLARVHVADDDHVEVHFAPGALRDFHPPTAPAALPFAQQAPIAPAGPFSKVRLEGPPSGAPAAAHVGNHWPLGLGSGEDDDDDDGAIGFGLSHLAAREDQCGAFAGEEVRSLLSRGLLHPPMELQPDSTG